MSALYFQATNRTRPSASCRWPTSSAASCPWPWSSSPSSSSSGSTPTTLARRRTTNARRPNRSRDTKTSSGTMRVFKRELLRYDWLFLGHENEIERSNWLLKGYVTIKINRTCCFLSSLASGKASSTNMRSQKLNELFNSIKMKVPQIVNDVSAWQAGHAWRDNFGMTKPEAVHYNDSGIIVSECSSRSNL